MATLDFNYDTRVITVLSPDIQIGIQELVNLIAAEKTTSLSMDDVYFIGASGSDPIAGQDVGYESIAVWEGKKLLTGVKSTEIVMTLLDWKLDFQEFTVSGPLEALIDGGSLLAIDDQGVGVNPIVSTVNVATIAQAVSGTLIETTANKQLLFAIESNSARSKGFKGTGDSFYVDPVNGDDANDGLLPERLSLGSLRGPKLTFAAAYALTTSARHDVVYLIQNQAGADTILNENLVLDKDDVHVRGQGKGLIIRPTDPSSPTIQITGTHVGLRDFRVQGLTGTAVACVECVGPEPNLDRLIIENGDGHGLLLRSTADHFEIVDCFVHDNGGTGVRVESCPDGLIMGGRVHTNDMGIHFQGPVDGHVIVDGIFIYDNADKGIRIDAGYEETFITQRTLFAENGTGQVGGPTPEHDIDDLEPTTTVVTRASDAKASSDRNIAIFEQSRGSHGWQGEVYYVDPVNGNDDHEGTLTNPFLSFGAAHAVVVSGRHDMILFVASGGAGVSELDESFTITKANLLVRGPGEGFRWKSTAAGDVITIAAMGVELSGFRVEGHNVGIGHAIHVNGGDSSLLHDLFIERAGGNGIQVTGASSGVIRHNVFKGRAGGPTPNITGHGVAVTGVSTDSYQTIEDNRFLGVGGDGVAIQGTVNDTMVFRNIFHDGAGWGLSVTAGSNGGMVKDNHLSNNALGAWTDPGDAAYFQNNEQWATDTAAAPISTIAADVALLKKHTENRLEVDFTAQELILYDDDGTSVLQRWPLETDAGEDVTTQVGVQTQRKVPLL